MDTKSILIDKAGIPIKTSNKRGKDRLIIIELLSPAMAFMTLIFVVGLFILFSYSFYYFNGQTIEKTLSIESYRKFLTDPYFLDIFGNAFKLGFTSTAICLLLGYPVAYIMSRIRDVKLLLITYVIIFSPLLVSIVVRAYGWLILLANTGLVNYLLIQLGIITEPIRLLYNFTGVTIALVHVLLPYAVFPILSVFVQLDTSLEEAAADLGANSFHTFLHIIFPLSLPGIFSAFQFCLVLSLTSYATPRLLGGGRVMVPSILMLETFAHLDWPLAAVLAIALLILVLMIVFVTNQLFKKMYQVT